MGEGGGGDGGGGGARRRERERGAGGVEARGGRGREVGHDGAACMRACRGCRILSEEHKSVDPPPFFYHQIPLHPDPPSLALCCMHAHSIAV